MSYHHVRRDQGYDDEIVRGMRQARFEENLWNERERDRSLPRIVAYEQHISPPRHARYESRIPDLSSPPTAIYMSGRYVSRDQVSTFCVSGRWYRPETG